MLRLISVLTLLLISACGVFAQAGEGWVSKSGNDANDCSYKSPCASFTYALTAAGYFGVVNVLDPGDYGTLDIGYPVTVNGNGMATVTVSSGDAVTVDTGYGTTILRGLIINGRGAGGNGVNYKTGSGLIIQDTEISNFTTGVNVVWTSGYPKPVVEIRNSTIHDNASVGVRLNSFTNGILEGVTLSNTPTGVYVNGTATAKHTMVYNAKSIAFEAQTGSIVNLEDCTASTGATGVYSAGKVTMSDTVVTGFTTGLKLGTGGTITSYGNNRIYGNTTNGSPTTTVSQE